LIRKSENGERQRTKGARKKDKLIVLLKEQGWNTSASSVGRILKYLKRRGDIIEPRGRLSQQKGRSGDSMQ
jgi:hypothetical protein